MYKFTFLGTLLAFTVTAQAQWANEQLFEELNPLKCKTKEWTIFIEDYGKRTDSEIAQVLNLIAPAKDDSWTSIANFLEVIPGDSGETLRLQNDRVLVYLQEITHAAVPSVYSRLMLSALTKFVNNLKAIPGVAILCRVPMPAGRMSGANKMEMK